VKGAFAVALHLLGCMLIVSWWGLRAGAEVAAVAISTVATANVALRFLLERAVSADGNSTRWPAVFRRFQASTIVSAALWALAAVAIYPHLDNGQRTVFLIGMTLALATTAVHFAGHPTVSVVYALLLLGAVAVGWEEGLYRDPLALVFLAICISVWRGIFMRGTRRVAALAARLARSMAARHIWATRVRNRLQSADMHAAQAKAQAAESRAMFVARISHELRTPLQTIISGLEVLQQDLAVTSASDPKRAVLIERVTSSADQVMLISHELADFVRWESGNLPVRSVETDVPRLINDIAAGLAERARLRGVRLAVDHWGTPGTNGTDAARLRAIVTNLLTNAIKYAPSGAVQLSTRRQPDGEIIIEVQDNGPGLPASVLKVLGSPWIRDEHARVQEEGFGLGLSIVMSLAQELRAAIDVDSSHLGTRFRVKIPAPTVE